MKLFGLVDLSYKYSDADIEKHLELNMKLLALIGVFAKLNGKENFTRFKLLRTVPVITIITIIFAVAAGFCQLLWMIDIMYSDREIATLISTNIFSNISCVGKGFRISTRMKQLQTLLDDVTEIWQNYQNEDKLYRKAIITCNKATSFVKFYIGIIGFLIFNLAIPPLTNMFFQYFAQKSLNHTYDYSDRIFTIKYPFPVDATLIWFILMCQEMWILFGLSLCWACCDVLFITLSTQLSVQFEILQNDIHKLLDHERNQKMLKKNFIILIHRHRKILRVCREMDNFFSPVVFINMLVASMNLCVNIYLLQEIAANGRYLDALFHLVLGLNVFLQIVIYCTFAENLTEKSLTVSKAIYNAQWVDQNKDFRTCVQIMIMSTQKPFYCTAYGFFPITHKKLMQIINTSVSYYMMLKTTSQS